MKKLLFLAAVLAAGVASVANAGWTVQNFDKANYVRPENAVGSSTSAMFDGNINTSGKTSDWYDHGLNFTTPKDITEVRVYPVGGTSSGYTRPNVFAIRVKYWGDDTLVELKSTGYGFSDGDGLTGDCIQMIFTPTSDFVAKRVSHMDVRFSGVAGDQNIGEIEFLGSDSFVPEIHATYLIGNARLNTSVTVKSQAYPVQTYFCYGEADGGDDLNAWDHVVEAGTATAGNVPFEEHRVVDFKYCRYYFCDPSFEVETEGVAWSETFVLNEEPSAELALITHGATTLGYQVTPTFCGGTNDIVKVSAAIALQGQPMPTLKEIKSGVSISEPVSIVFDALDPVTEYDYLVRVENADGNYVDLSGTTTTRYTTEWVKGTYTASTWTLPDNWLSPCGDGRSGHDGLLNAKVSDGSDERYGLQDGTFHAVFTEAKDIDKITVLMNSSTAIEVKKVEVVYDGAVETNELPYSSIDYREGISGSRKLEFLAVDGGWVVENVKEITITFGYCNPNNVGGAEICFTGRPHGGNVKWSVGKLDVSTYSPSPDELEGLTMSEKYKGVLTDHDVTTDAFTVNLYYGGGDIIWEFEHAMDIRCVRLISSAADDYQGFGVKGAWVKYKGEADWTYLEGSYADKFFFGLGQFASLGTQDGKGYLARNVVAVKVVPFVWNWRWRAAEVECCGRPSAGLMLIVK